MIKTFAKANRMIGGQAPSGYLHQLQSYQAVQLDETGLDAIVRTHCIDPNLLRQDDFEGFMASRKRMLLAKIEGVMGKAIVISDEAVPEDAVDNF
jgi:hypothetical protein